MSFLSCASWSCSQPGTSPTHAAGSKAATGSRADQPSMARQRSSRGRWGGPLRCETEVERGSAPPQFMSSSASSVVEATRQAGRGRRSRAVPRARTLHSLRLTSSLPAMAVGGRRSTSTTGAPASGCCCCGKISPPGGKAAPRCSDPAEPNGARGARCVGVRRR